MAYDLDPRRQRELTRLVEKLGLSEGQRVQWQLLDQALSDISASPGYNNQQLEFLGDAVLRLAAAEFLREAHPQMAVGEMAAVRSQLVSDRTLAALAARYGLEQYLWLSASASSDKAGHASRLADAFEAVLGALYLSTQDFQLIRPWLDLHFEQLTQQIQQDPARHNYKAALQELTQAHHKQLPAYRVTEISQRHGDPERFQAEVWYQEQVWGQGKGPSIKQAEHVAARAAYDPLKALLGKLGSKGSLK
ncbi:MAG: ribonuclease III [Leptolyngbya sp. SIO4C1]|nr:ribonuclease III [Leptolyngbya sp. SIO4C1]